MLIITVFLLLVIIYALLSPYPIREKLENELSDSKTSDDKKGNVSKVDIYDANTINAIKNQINILELKVDGIKRQLATTDVRVTANQTVIAKFNKMIDDLQKQLKDAESSMG